MPYTHSAVVLGGSEPFAPPRHPDGVFLAVGVDDSAPLPAREGIAGVGDCPAETYRDLLSRGMAEAIILATCNRTELYMFTADPKHAGAQARAFLLERSPQLGPHLREWRGMDAVEHVLRVGAGLESRVLGERQILGQVRQALTVARSHSAAGTYLQSLFRATIACGREVRRATALGQVDASVSVEAVCRVEASLGSLHERSALLVGAGQVSRLAAAELRRRGIGQLFVTNRTPSAAEELARRYGGRAVSLGDVHRLVREVDVVISATSAPGRVLNAHDVAGTNRDPHRPLLVIDLAMPRDVDPAVGALPAVTLCDLDSMGSDANRALRDDDMRRAEEVVDDYRDRVQRWYSVRRVTPFITALRRDIDELTATELARSAPSPGRAAGGEQEAVDRFAHRLADALFHRFVTRLQGAACGDAPWLDDAAELFFGPVDPSPRHDRGPYRFERVAPAGGVER